MARFARIVAIAVAVALVAPAGPALADPRKEGDYTGAKPGVRPGAEHGKPQKPPPKGTLSWIGFEAKEGGSAVVWLQAASSFEVSQRVRNGVLIVNVTGLKRLGRNTWRPVDTRFFDNPLSRIVAKRKKRGLEIRISFKNARDARDATTRTATEADGLFYTYLEFPPGTGSTTTTDSKIDRTGGDVDVDDAP